ncbi:C13 family peptidase [Paracidovorax sp. MALMAid1276]|uniref:C13 family peptidase n=1 Tax=Paracidovorax sp. MALMAid1276 TaxID=3411631 RepID=UPI003B9B0AC0
MSSLLAGCGVFVPPPLQSPPPVAEAPVPPPPPEPAGRIIFAGLAMHSQAKAFRNDIELAEKWVRDIDPNALLVKLANPTRDQVSDWPQVTAENFALVMAKTAEVAQPRDRVLLFISTHGNPGLLQINAAGKHLQPLTTRMLSDALAPLKNVPTLVVLSACYSGAFIEPLEAPNRVVLTSTDVRRTSFNCRYPGNHTPFAEALFGQADAGSRSATDWMEEAQKTITAQEKRRKLSPSRPRLFVGEDAKAWADRPLGLWLQAPPGP